MTTGFAKMHFRYAKIVMIPCLLICAWGFFVGIRDERFDVALFCVALSCFCYYLLAIRTEEIPCANCGGWISPKTPWSCGDCGHANWNVWKYSIVSRCESCRHEPKAYQCHHCSALVFLGQDHQILNYAVRIIAMPVVVFEPIDPEASRRAYEKAELQHRIELFQMAEPILPRKQIVDTAALVKPLIQRNLEKYYNEVMGAEEYAQQKYIEVDQVFKDDERKRLKAHDTIKAWLRTQT